MGIASRAFTARFITTCSIWLRSAFTVPRSDLRSISSVRSSPIKRGNIFCMSETRAFKSRTMGVRICWRLNARSCLVRAAARCPAFSTSSANSASSVCCGATRCRISLLYPIITPRRLLKSCAMPPDSRPIASIFPAIRSWRSRIILSVTSCAKSSIEPAS